MPSTTLEQIRKRDGRIVPFDRAKIVHAILKAARSVQVVDPQQAEDLADRVISLVALESPEISGVERVQDAIEKVLIDEGQVRIARAFILYRARRSRIREAKTELMMAVEEILAEVEHDEGSLPCSPSEKMQRIGATASTEFYLKRYLPEEMADAHLRGDLHIQDLEHYAKAPNSFVIPLERLLRRGYRTEFGTVRPPKRAHSAARLAAIALQAAQNDCFGGQVFAGFDAALAAALPPETSDGELIQAMESLIYDLNMLHSRAGGQVPYSTLTLGLDPAPTARRVARALLEAYGRGLGRGEPAVYPNLVFMVQSGRNFLPQDPNHDLFELAMAVASSRMQPTFAFLDAPHNQDQRITYLSGCARLAPDRHGILATEGRGAVATVALNLPRIALKARRDRLDPMSLLERQARLAIRTLIHRLGALSSLKARELPFLMGERLYAGSESLSPHDEVGAALRHGQLALSFVGLAEMLKLWVGGHHGEREDAQELGLEVVGKLRGWVDEASEQHDLNVVLYGQQGSKAAVRFPLLDARDHGELAGVTDKPYYTSSFALPVDFVIDAGRKITIEAPYHALCSGGHLTTIEWAAPPDRPEELHSLLVRMAEAGIGQGAVNFPLDHCGHCGYVGLIPDTCPRCLVADAEIRRIRRMAGYLAPLERFGPAKLEELKARTPNG